MCTGITFRASNGDVILEERWITITLEWLPAVQPRGYL